MKKEIYQFAKESNNIESIYAARRHKIHAEALKHFLTLKEVTVFDLEQFVKEIEPSAFLRTEPHHRVWIGGNQAPEAPKSVEMLKELLNNLYEAYEAHCDYEMIHPFIDGNGRSGRALWLWMMVKRNYDMRYGFLQMFYYQTLQRYRGLNDTKS